MSYTGIGIVESLLDYKFLVDMGLESGEFEDYDDLKRKVRKEYRFNGINILTNDKIGNRYYNGVKNISRYDALTLINTKNGSRLNVNNYLE